MLDRQAFIIDYLKEHDFVDIGHLSRELNVSEMTIRRDFNKLEAEERIIRVHGGAVLRPASTYEAPLNERLAAYYTEKQELGKYAASLLEDGDVIALDASSTVLTMLEHINKEITVVTNNIQAAATLMRNPKVEVTLLGGSVRKTSASTVGFDTVHMMKQYHIEKLFFSSKAVDPTCGVTDATVHEAEVKKAMLERCRESYLLIDPSKINQCAFYKVCGLESCNHIIANRILKPTREQELFFEKCQKSGAQLHFSE